MLLSMTGFGTKSGSITDKRKNEAFFSVEVKSVNSRFFEAVCKIPGALSYLEVDIISKVQKELLRGRIYVTVRFIDNSIFEEIIPSVEVAKGYVKAAKVIKNCCKDISGSVSIENLMNLEGVFIVKKKLIK